LPDVLRRRDLDALDGVEGQGGSELVSDTEQGEDVDLSAILTADLPSDQAPWLFR
jgi:ParB family chromosome partitioning protein